MIRLDFEREAEKRGLDTSDADIPEKSRQVVLEDMLGDPRPDEWHFRRIGKQLEDAGATLAERLTALEDLVDMKEQGKISVTPDQNAPNTHVHTNASFSIFRSPAEAVWQAVKEGVSVYGINDHYTLAGHPEFARAAEIADLAVTFSMEAVGMSAEAKSSGQLYNDPKNPGRTYLSAKGVTRPLEKNSEAEKLLAGMTGAIEKRHREMAEKLSDVLSAQDQRLSFTFKDVQRLTPAGNVTERHISEYAAELAREVFQSNDKVADFFGKASPDFDRKVLSDHASFQNWIRSAFLKAGKPAYVEELAEAFLSWDDMKKLYLAMGAVPTYPVLGNPVVDREKDIRKLLSELDEKGWHAIEVVPHRNTKERLREIVFTARDMGFPVMSGTEHNTKTPMPLLDGNTLDPEFKGLFMDGAYFLLGHQVLKNSTGTGFVAGDGSLHPSPRKQAVAALVQLGRMSRGKPPKDRRIIETTEKMVKG